MQDCSPPDTSIRRELVLIKVQRRPPSEARNEVIQMANIFRASIIDVSVASLTLAVIGDESKAEAIQNLLREFGILELVRTGMVALERGQFTIDEQTKVKGEYDYGKNVLRKGLRPEQADRQDRSPSSATARRATPTR